MSRLTHQLASRIRRFLSREDGGVLTYFAISLSVLLGAAGLSVDVTIWYMQKRGVQTIADAAALSGALEIVRLGDTSGVMSAAQEGADSNGFNAGGDQITINNPPSSGDFAGDSSAVEVLVTRQLSSLFSSLVFDGAPVVTARAVAAATEPPSDACIWVLDPSMNGALSVGGNATVNVDCGIEVASSSQTALTQSGASCLNADTIKIVGDYSGSCVNPAAEDIGSVTDPYGGMTAPAYGGCDHTGTVQVKPNKSGVLSPGVYCGDIDLKGNATLNAGLYVLDGGSLTINSQATVNGAGVTFYIPSSNINEIRINGGATVNLEAPGSATPASNGAIDGVLLYQDRGSPGSTTHRFNGGSSMQLDGLIYVPNEGLWFNGGNSANGSPMKIVADRINFNGGADFGSYQGSAAETAIPTSGNGGVKIVE